MKRPLFALASMFFCIASASGAEWYGLNTTKFGFLFVDKESRVDTGSQVKVWVIESPRQTRDAYYVYAQQLMVFDCAQKTYSVKQRQIFKQDLVALQDSSVPTIVQEPAPDSKEQLLLKYSCAPDSGLAVKVEGVQSLLRQRADARAKGLFDDF